MALHPSTFLPTQPNAANPASDLSPRLCFASSLGLLVPWGREEARRLAPDASQPEQ